MAYRMVKVPANAYGFRVPSWMNQLNNLPATNASDFATINVYLLDDVIRGQGVQGAGSARAVQHESCCNNVFDLFSNVFDGCNVHSVRMQAGQRQDDFTKYIAGELEKYTPDDLVIFYYHGKAGRKGDDYTWRFRGPGPRRINAHDFICQVNDSPPDCYFILDCFVPTKFSKLWKRKESMTEFTITGHQTRNSHAQPISGPENFTETLCRAVRDIKQRPRGDSRQSVHRIMARDKEQCSRPIRLWTARPNRRKDVEVWRFFVDIDRMKETGSLELRKCKVTGRRLGDGEFDSDSDDDGNGDDNEDNDEDDEGDEGEDDDSNDDGDTRGDHDQDGGDDNHNAGSMWKKLRKVREETFRDNPEAIRIMRDLHNCLQPARQPARRAPKRQRLFGQQLPPTGVGGSEIVGPSDRDDGESLFLPRNSTQRPPVKRAKRTAETAIEDIGHNTNVMDLGDEDEAANDANNASLIERLIDQNNNDVSRPHLRAISRVPSPTLKEEKKDDSKRSSSPYFQFGGDPTSSDSNPIKRERSISPGFEITGSRFIPCHIDLTDDDGVVDLTQEDELEES